MWISIFFTILSGDSRWKYEQKSPPPKNDAEKSHAPRVVICTSIQDHIGHNIEMGGRLQNNEEVDGLIDKYFQRYDIDGAHGHTGMLKTAEDFEGLTLCLVSKLDLSNGDYVYSAAK